MAASANAARCKQKNCSSVPDESDCNVGIDTDFELPSAYVRTPAVSLMHVADKTVCEKLICAAFWP